ncbi:hypothetical protein [Mesorhizobium captivum]|uniref:hypothetical protein n=1 Tax=Mesorhizobium captivum TaxID=3072319 RepID=UPI002A23ABAA|nr:hypothetical protein [Mesorhizobium sp. VK3C]MDX8448300.1 hypothetical protein [Mesorhizobium sp. VK3C]
MDFAKRWSEERLVDRRRGRALHRAARRGLLRPKALSKKAGAIDYARLVDGGDIFPARHLEPSSYLNSESMFQSDTRSGAATGQRVS